MVMTSRVQGIQDRLVANGQKVVNAADRTGTGVEQHYPERSGGDMPVRETDNLYQRWILAALNNPKLGKHIYAATADPVVVSKRRKANKVARKQRRVNRG